MSQSTTGGGWTAASNATVRAHSGRTSSQHAESEGIRLAGLHNPTQTGHANLRKPITANTTIVICWLILLMVTIVVLELHIRRLTRHSFLSQPQIPSALSAVKRSTSGSPLATCMG